MRKSELVFVPAPGAGHLLPTVEFARRLLDQDEQLSITMLVIKAPFLTALDMHIKKSLAATNHGNRIQYINLPEIEQPSVDPSVASPEKYVSVFIENHRHHVADAISHLVLSESTQVVGLVVDLFCTSMIDVANQFNLPSYLFFTSTAAFLGFMLYLPIRHGQVGKNREFSLSDSDSLVPSYSNPVPVCQMPTVVMNRDGGYSCVLDHAMKFKGTKGIIVNSFAELEPYAVQSLKSDRELPPIYAVGPVLNLQGGQKNLGADQDEILRWLDNQPSSSVLFLCFGSVGFFSVPQMEQIAIALEKSGVRFLWSMRKPLAKDESELAKDYANYEGILPEGFLERCQDRGRVCGWAPQAEVLAHKALRAFVSHCGWNSFLESLWFGVPIVTWPMYAEQQINAFEMVRELGLAVELKLDYRLGGTAVVMADEIEAAVRRVMDEQNPVRKGFKEMGEKSRKAVEDGGSSFTALRCLIQDILSKRP